MQQITRGDYLKDLITIFIENNLQQDITDLYSQFIFQCGSIQKTFTPAQVIKISFNEQESLQLKNINVCYLAGITIDGHKETFNGSLTFNTRGEVVMYEPANSASVNVTTSDAPQCVCQGLNAVYSNCCQPAIKAYFSLNYVPTKLSELQNDTDFQDSVDVAEAISEHNESELAHSYIQGLITDAQADLNGKIGDLTDLESSVKSNIVNAINSVISDTETVTGDLADLETSSTTNLVSSINSVLSDTNTLVGELSDLDTSVKTSIVDAINSEVSDRQSADNNIQAQIDAITASSDVTDIVGTYAGLEAYDTSNLPNNSIIKVLQDESQNNETTYYRWVITGSIGVWVLIGEEGPYYTIAAADETFVKQSTTINGKALNSNITLLSSDVEALANTTTINDLTTTAQQRALNSGATTTNIGQIATNTSNISSINSKIPSDASSNNKLVTANTLSNAVVDLANQDLSNLSETGNNRLHALKGYCDNGEVLTDAEGLADVTSYAHSTYDGSKFTSYIQGSAMTITDDGIASGFVQSPVSNIKITDVPSTNNYTIEGEFTTLAALSSSMGVPFSAGVTVNGSLQILFSLRINNSYNPLLLARNTNSSNTNLLDNTVTVSANTSYKYKIVVNNVNVSFYLNDSLIASMDNFCELVPDFFIIGADRSNQTPWTSTTDLKYFAITEGGVLFFSGNKTGTDTYTISGESVSIPYTFSKTGSKIALASARADITALYNQQGYAPYYTLDRENDNFTLPMGELYGMIGQRALINNYRNGITYWELWNDKTLEIGGTCESGVEYTLPKPFSDSNYILTIPYSSKTATTFIPSATGDFIAKGVSA